MVSKRYLNLGSGQRKRYYTMDKLGVNPRYLNLGSGQRVFSPPYWTNWDIQVEKWKKFTEDKGCLWGAPWTGEPWDIICLHHVLEHFGCGEADSLVKQCKDHLKDGGSLLVFVPDLRILAKRWLVGQLDTQLYLTQLYGAYMGDEADRHKWGGDREYWMGYLEGFGWSKVKEFDWRSIEGMDAAKDYYIIGLECIK